MAGLNIAGSYITEEKPERVEEAAGLRRIVSAPAAVDLSQRRKDAAASLRRISEEVHRQKFPHVIEQVRREQGLSMERSVSVPNDAMFNRAWRYACNFVAGWSGV